ncbi:MAG: C-GCAxxG-C-C family protein [Candidatus Riflebacteria bacterium]|nr:C-GCAxxG-C-C family protein [Candidatus Riflebacteria bacterium]MDD3001082.1 C-GCAxxG-C-C family protein [Candidatus Riflebacteria bacterium]
MNERIKKAVDNYNSGYNCAQSILCAYSAVMGISESEAYRLAEGFGSGMGGLQETCGAVSGMFTVLSYLNSDGTPGSRKTRGITYKKVRDAAGNFKGAYGSLICREILLNKDGVGCVKKVEDAAKILESFLDNSQKPENTVSEKAVN